MRQTKRERGKSRKGFRTSALQKFRETKGKKSCAHKTSLATADNPVSGATKGTWPPRGRVKKTGW